MQWMYQSSEHEEFYMGHSDNDASFQMHYSIASRKEQTFGVKTDNGERCIHRQRITCNFKLKTYSIQYYNLKVTLFWSFSVSLSSILQLFCAFTSSESSRKENSFQKLFDWISVKKKVLHEVRKTIMRKNMPDADYQTFSIDVKHFIAMRNGWPHQCT